MYPAREAAQRQAHSSGSSGAAQADPERDTRNSLYSQKYLWLQQRDAWTLGHTLYAVLTHEVFPGQTVFLQALQRARCQRGPGTSTGSTSTEWARARSRARCRSGCSADVEQDEELFRRQRRETRERITAKLEAAVAATRCGATYEVTARMLEFSCEWRLPALPQ